MKKKMLLIGLLSTLITNYLFAQLHPNLAGSSNGTLKTISLFVKGDVEKTKAVVSNLGGYFKYASGDISAIVLPANQYDNFLKSEFYDRVERPYHKVQLMGDQSLINNGVVSVQAGSAPLTQGYDGTGVVIGILDSGLDFNHTDFKLANGHSRVKYLWDQTMTSGGSVPSPYNYGIHWDSTHINNHTCTHVPNSSFYGHGTLTTGVACGNSQGRSSYRAIAPNADIIFVAVDLNGVTGNSYETCVVDGAAYCFAKAAALGKPCVVNASLGSYSGSHDGTDLATQLIENMVTSQPGRMFVAAAGNAGAVKLHLGYPIPTDSAYTYFNDFNSGAPYGRIVYFELYADSANFRNAQFAIGADKTSPSFNHRNRTKLLNVVSDYQMWTAVNNFTRIDTLKNNIGKRLGIVETYCEKQGGNYFMFFFVDVDSSTNYTWRFLTKGTGRFDIWSHASYTGTSTMRSTGLPTVLQLPDIAKYAMPDTEQTIVSGWNCSSKLISVANYLNRNHYTTFQGNNFICDGRTQGQRYPTSSKGPTRTGLQKPDIAASGEWTMAANDLYWLNWAKTNNPNSLYSDTMHGPHKGTSAAAPAVAGVIALYLQKYPNASWSDIKASMITCAKTDVFTGNSLPNTVWGYGKIDAFKMLNCKGCNNPISVNYNSLSQINDGSCIAPPAAINDLPCYALNGSANSGSISGTNNLASYDHGASLFNGLSNNPTSNPPSGPNLIYYSGSTSLATNNGLNEPTPTCGVVGTSPKTIWFKFKAPTMGGIDVTIRTNYTSTNFNTLISAYIPSQNPCNNGTTYTAIGCSNNGTLILNSFNLSAYAGQDIYVQLMGNGVSSPFGNYCISLQGVPLNIALVNTSSSKITVNFPTVSGATAYRLYWKVATANGYCYTSISPSTSTYTITGLLPATNYKVWACYSNTQQSFYSLVQTSTTTVGCIGTSVAATVTPFTSPIHCTKLTVSWPAISNALPTYGYRLYWQLVGSSGYNTVALTNPNYTISNLNLNANYQIWYKAICNDNTTILSPISNASTCGAPARQSPEYESSVWESNGVVFVNEDPRVIAENTDLTIPNGKVQAITLNHFEATIASKNFDSLELKNRSTVTLQPNPADDLAVLKYVLPSIGNLQITIRTIDGRLMNTYPFYASNMEGYINFDVHNYAAGVYLITIQGTDFIQTTKLMVAHK
jgi:subtilisin family serine protease